LETFTTPKELVENPHYREQKQKSLADLKGVVIDTPIIEHINQFNRLPFCFTLQSCYGHFLHNGQKDPHNFDPLPITNAIARVDYRIAYVAFCIDNSDEGKGLFDDLKTITSIDHENIQLCCAEWFWKRQVNSYALQVEPARFKYKDKAILGYQEALIVEKIREGFFNQLRELLRKQHG
jgi:hypothetical protein